MMIAHGLTGLGVLAPSSVLAAWHMAPDAKATDFDRLMGEAEQQRNLGDHAAAGRSYAAAYRGLPETDKLGLLGELAIENALVAYGKASELQPEDLTLLEEPEALLDDFITARARAHGAGQAEAVPSRLEQELEWLRTGIHERRTRQSVAEMPPPTEARTNEHDANVEIFSVGVLALAGGTVLVGGGAWNFAIVNRRSEARLEALEGGVYSVQRRREFEAELSAWQDHWRRTATGMVIAGSLLTAAGIGLTTWGAVRMRRSRGASRKWRSIGLPMVVRGGVGVVVTLGRRSSADARNDENPGSPREPGF